MTDRSPIPPKILVPEESPLQEASPTPRAPRVGVFGGTFDPPHVGHLIAATELRHALGLDRVLFVPAGRPPHKRGSPITDDAHRLAMLRLALEGALGFELSTVDLDRGGPSFTADLLAELTGALPDRRFVFLMGDDSLRDLPTWYQPERIAALAEIGVATRPNVDVDLEAVFRAVPAARGRVHVVATPAIDISSSNLRDRVRAGAPIRYQVPLAVERYIETHRLYRPAKQRRVAPGLTTGESK